MVKIIDIRKIKEESKLSEIPLEPETEEQIRKREEDRVRRQEDYRTEIKHPELLRILREELPKSYYPKPVDAYTSQIGIYKRALWAFFKEERCKMPFPGTSVGYAVLYKSSSQLEDEICINNVHLNDTALVSAVKRTAERFEKIKGREINLLLGNY